MSISGPYGKNSSPALKRTLYRLSGEAATWSRTFKMIEPAKKRLTIVSLSLLVMSNILILLIIFTILHYILINNAKEHIMENIATEFMPHYKNNDLDTLRKIIEDEKFQILNREGEVVLDVQSSVHFIPPVNKSDLEAAFSDKHIFKIINPGNISYMVSYLPLDRNHILRVILSMEELSAFRKNFIIISLLTLPVMLLLSYILSRYMVAQSLEPVIRIFNYQETFSSSITHELNSPLTSIKGSLEVGLRRERSAEEYRNILKSALGRVNRLIDLLNNLFLLATSKFKPLDLLKEEVNIGTMIKEIIENYEPYLFNKDIKVNLAVDQDNICRCDSSLMRRAIENLIDNATKYTSTGGKVEIKTLHDRKNFILSISNTYNGITINDMKNLFKPFTRGKNSSASHPEGKGLGLHIVQYIGHSHGGTISVSFDNNMLTFIIKMPT
jgi:signal transduction histidine kinase